MGLVEFRVQEFLFGLGILSLKGLGVGFGARGLGLQGLQCT